jgi:uncharacterized protein YjbJ (UPF0337 family)
MNKDILEGKWNEMKGKVKQQWGDLTDDDISQVQGSYEQLLGKIQKSYGYERDRAEKEIDAFLKKNGYED